MYNFIVIYMRTHIRARTHERCFANLIFLLAKYFLKFTKQQNFFFFTIF